MWIRSIKVYRFTIWSGMVIELCLYGTRDFLHHKLFNHPQESLYSCLSWIVAVTALLFATHELSLIVRYIYKFYYRLESYIISDLTSSRGSAFTRLLSQYELNILKLKARQQIPDRHIEMMKQNLKTMHVKSMIAHHTNKRVEMSELKRALELKLDMNRLSLREYEKQLKRSHRASDLTAFDIYPGLQKKTRANNDEFMFDGAELPLLRKHQSGRHAINCSCGRTGPETSLYEV
jgi:hypothetical protein